MSRTPLKDFCCSAVDLRGDAAQCPSYVAFAQALERTVAQLADALARDAKHGADLFERVFATALESEVQTEYLRVARRQRTKCKLDLIGEEAIHGFLFGVRHLVGDEAFDERAIAFGVHGRVETHIAGVERGERLHHVDREARQLRQLFGTRLATELLTKDLRRLDDA